MRRPGYLPQRSKIGSAVPLWRRWGGDRGASASVRTVTQQTSESHLQQHVVVAVVRDWVMEQTMSSRGWLSRCGNSGRGGVPTPSDPRRESRSITVALIYILSWVFRDVVRRFAWARSGRLYVIGDSVFPTSTRFCPTDIPFSITLKSRGHTLHNCVIPLCPQWPPCTARESTICVALRPETKEGHPRRLTPIGFVSP